MGTSHVIYPRECPVYFYTLQHATTMASCSKSSTKKVSEVKIPARGSRYFNFTLQERDEKHRVVCFHPDKRDDLKQKEESKLPVRILQAI